MKKWEISRRACLRGTGAMIGLPTLEAMLPGLKRAGAAGSTPKRLVFFVFNGGTPDPKGTGMEGRGVAGSFWPKTPGANYETTRVLQPLDDLGLKKDILVVQNLHNVPGTPDHTGQFGSILSGTMSKLDSNDNLAEAGISVDRVAAQTLKQYTPGLPSLFLANQGIQIYSWAMSWTGPKSKTAPTVQVSDAYRQVFGSAGVDPATLKRQLSFKKSILDHVKADADRLKKKLGSADQETLAKYFDSIASLEGRISASSQSTDGCKTPPGQHADTVFNGTQYDMPSHYQKMADLITLAFQCDRTRVVAVQLFVRDVCFKWLGSPNDKYSDYHDDLEHAANDGQTNVPERLEAYTRSVANIVAQFGYLVDKLKKTPEGDGSGSLLDNTILACTSEMSFGSGHPGDHLPVIVAGRGGGSVSPGRHMAVPNGGRPIADLWLSMLNAVGVEDTSFGNSTGPLPLG